MGTSAGSAVSPVTDSVRVGSRPGRLSLRTRVLVLVGATTALVAVVLAVLVATVAAVQSADRARERVLRPADKAAALLQARMIDQETGQRGFLLTGDPDFLAPYQLASDALPGIVAELRRLLADRPELDERLTAVVDSHARWTEANEPELRLAESGRLDDAQRLVATGRSRELFERVRADQGRLDEGIAAESAADDSRVEQLGRRLNVALVATLLAMVGFVLVVLYAVLHLVLTPLTTLSRSVRRVAAGGLHRRIGSTGPAELARLGDDVEQMRTRLVTEIDEARRATEALTQQGPAVTALRSALAPAPTGTAGLEVTFRIEPAEGVLAGDWCDVVDLGGGRTALVLGDVSGHGAGPGVFAHRLKHSLVAALDAGLEPGQALAVAGGRLGDSDPAMLATVFVAVVDPALDQLRYGSAGHLPALHFDGTARTPAELGPTGPLLCRLTAAAGWRTDSVKFLPEHLVLALTDGIVEARDPDGREFGAAAVATAVTGSDGRPLADPVASLFDGLHRFCRPSRLRDDCSAIACRRIR